MSAFSERAYNGMVRRTGVGATMIGYKEQKW
jgi:hypothetical protein